MNSRTILIWYNNGEQRFSFTVNPERLSISRPNCNRVETLALGGEINLWGGRGLREGDADIALTLTLREYKFTVETGGSGTAASGQKSGRTDERVTPKTRTVRRGDTLWGIACELYGDGTRWREIAKKNGITEPRRLQIGTVLTL